MSEELQDEIYGQFVEEFVNVFAKNKKLYRFGKTSGKIFFIQQTYGDIANFVCNLKSSNDIFKTYIKGKVQGRTMKLDYSTAIQLWDYVFKHHEDEIKEAILRENGTKGMIKEPSLTVKTYDFEGKEVVFLSFYLACYEKTDYYAIPKKVALKLCLEDYKDCEMSEYDKLWQKLKPYKIEEDFMFKGESIRTFNYA